MSEFGEPWRCKVSLPHGILDKDGRWLAIRGKKRAHVVKCINACVGLDLDDVPDAAQKVLMRSVAVTLTVAVTEELRDALKLLLKEGE